jgi:hypothetical protein
MAQHQPSGQPLNSVLKDGKVKVRRDEHGNLILGDEAPAEPTNTTTETPPPPPRDDPRSVDQKIVGYH